MKQHQKKKEHKQHSENNHNNSKNLKFGEILEHAHQIDLHSHLRRVRTIQLQGGLSFESFWYWERSLAQEALYPPTIISYKIKMKLNVNCPI